MVDTNPLLILSSSSSQDHSYHASISQNDNRSSSIEKIGWRRPLKKSLLLFTTFGAIFFIILSVKYNKKYDFINTMMTSTTPAAPIIINVALPEMADREVNDGVFEKSFQLPQTTGAELPFPWTNCSMLAWQRTAYHFQPRNKWMSGL
ncbi:hypothetical protein Sjap_020439 [Stephania japonica]|uniref:Beta-fructofuranosidase n=1 Tax=Stephania japonica TaxID=461633 RepID=A0AAP0I0F6_9MAGN